MKFQVDSGSTCCILPVSVYEDISGDHDLNYLNTTVRPVLSLNDEETKIQALGTRKIFAFNPATNEEVIIQFRKVDKDFTPLMGLNDSEAEKKSQVSLQLLQKSAKSPNTTHHGNHPEQLSQCIC